MPSATVSTQSQPEQKLNGTSGKTPSANSIGEQVQDYANRARDTAGNLSNQAAETGRNVLDRFSTPEQREALVDKAQTFINAHPKVSALLGLNLIFTGIPLLLFILFSITTLITSVVVALVVALSVAITFTLFSIGIALLVLLPVVFFTTASACILFSWGLAGYFVLHWATSEKSMEDGQRGRTIGERLNSLTGGRLEQLVGQAQNAKSEIEGQKDKFEESAPTNGNRNQTEPKVKVEEAAKNTFGADNVEDTLNGRVPRSVVETTEQLKKNVGGK
jgi:ABC-type multidrug transport system fused ATPase/permease subunit